MYKTILSALILCLFCGVTTMQAQQLSKEEFKKWKNIAKDYKKNPAALKKLTESKTELEREKADLAQQVSTLEAEKNMKDSRISALEVEVSSLESQLAEAQASFEEYTAPDSDPNEVMPMGVLYRVQIGAYKETQIPGTLDTGDDMSLESGDNMQKVVLGQFREYAEAQELKNYLVTMGVTDAWIVSYRDGQRVPLEDAMNN